MYFDSNIKAHTIKRIDSDFKEEKITDSKFQSATAIRNIMLKSFNEALEFVPSVTRPTLVSEYNLGFAPCESERLSSAIITNLRLNSSPKSKIHDVDDGLYNRLRNASFKTDKLISLIELAGTKKYTNARIRRSIWYSLFGVTSSDIKEFPHYTQILAMDTVGTSILKEIKKKTDFHIITKPSSTNQLSDIAKRQKSLSDTADSVFELTKPRFSCGNNSLKTSPFILK